MMKLKDLMKLYGVVLLLHLSVVHIGESENLIILSKGLLMVILAIWFFDQSKWASRWTKIFGVAQILSFAGDMLLEFEGLFLVGLGSFLLAQVAYFSSFWIWSKKSGATLTQSILALLPPVALMFLLVVPRANNAGELMVPILVYAVILSAVWWLVIRLFLSNRSQFGLLLVGSTVFLISDAILAFQLFLGEVPHSSLWIMSTYGIAQFIYTVSAHRQLEMG